MWANAAWAEIGRVEQLVTPGRLIEGHAKYETQCEKCHDVLSKETQTKLCRECHDKVDTDIYLGRGYHGRIKGIQQMECKRCHTDHKGREADILLLNEGTFRHDNTDYTLKGAHAKVKCASCHKPQKKHRDAPQACVDCHKDDDPHRGELGRKCADCHNEKTWKKETTFDHDKTDYPLRGKHRDVACASCHPAERYKDIPSDCNACHRVNDVHARRYGEKCKDCHQDSGWKDVKFDHDRDTKYKLEGRHRNVACDDCHTGHLYRDKLKVTCIACHKEDDEHRGRFGARCEDCHNIQSWGKIHFDHDRDTQFPLRGRHAKVACNDCHPGGDLKKNLGMDCLDCHRKDDVHKGQEGKQCERCHNEETWKGKVRFDHDLTGFPLIGLHAPTPCEECHLTAAYKDTPRECVRCHEAEDVHKATLGRDCALCHNPNHWRLWAFDHDKRTKFALDGAHAEVSCKACHKIPLDEKPKLPLDCYGCHRADDVHHGDFGRNCERCHDTDEFSGVEVIR
jgi:hypothetical protein